MNETEQYTRLFWRSFNLVHVNRSVKSNHTTYLTIRWFYYYLFKTLPDWAVLTHWQGTYKVFICQWGILHGEICSLRCPPGSWPGWWDCWVGCPGPPWNSLLCAQSYCQNRNIAHLKSTSNRYYTNIKQLLTFQPSLNTTDLLLLLGGQCSWKT